ncbi:hypothetical protein [Paeniglutamicibacter psychrophenolicus]|uniref:hypothetical protein n=1 Tax=Paeniglutamicibacter psychrophenolicus TaxID=257454 RepID=UPI0027892E82|nr:hypothetical protein [Paeniglutamicibacter psychrophenolicus]MDQ0096117.1 hypothetical protein [Paeniglutamicibacter psychrophenolicus]
MDALAKDGPAALTVSEGLKPEPAASSAGELLATLLGQDLVCVDGVFSIARRVAKVFGDFHRGSRGRAWA